MGKVQPTTEHDVTAPLRRSLVLEVHTDSVNCLAALDGDRLASGSWVNSSSIIIWNLADGTQLAKLEGHTDSVNCLAALDGDRLASGSDDESIIIWSVADGSQHAKLEGHTGWVNCLAALDGGRLASGSEDTSIRIWSVAEEKHVAKLEGHTEAVSCLVKLDGGRLASGSRDTTIRVRPVLHKEACKFTECGSAFAFEVVARACRDQNRLGDLLDAATMNAIDKEFMREYGVSVDSWDASAAVTTQAHVFDAIAKVVNEGEDQKESIDSLAQSVLVLVCDDDLLLDMERRGVSDTALQELAPSPLFRVMLDAKFSAGPVFVLYFELLLFIVLGGCFTRVAAFEVLGESKYFAIEKAIEIVVAFAILAHFSAREIHQMWSTRAIELEETETPIDEAQGLAWYALAVPRYGLLLVMLVPLLMVALVCKILVKLNLLDRASPWTFIISDLMNTWNYGFRGDTYTSLTSLNSPIFKAIRHDPLTFLGLPRAWRGDYWNWLDVATLGSAWAAFARAAMPGTNMSTDHAAATAMLLWLLLFGFLKNLNQSLATFVLMFERIVRDLRVFMVFFLMIMLMFGSAFYLYLGQHEAEEFGFHDDGAPNSFESARMTIFSLLLLAFVGDYDLDNYPRQADRG